MVYRTPHYQQDWGAAGLPDGVYFYHLRRAGASTAVKGWFEVHR